MSVKVLACFKIQLFGSCLFCVDFRVVYIYCMLILYQICEHSSLWVIFHSINNALI